MNCIWLKLTISSPLEAHKSHTIVYDTCGVYVGHDNPLYAVIETNYGDPEEFDAGVVTGEIKKSLTYYEMDLGLNHVIRKHTEEIDSSSTNVVAVPLGKTGKGGPGGVIVFAESSAYYRRYPDKIKLQCKFPRRLGSDEKVIITSHAVCKSKDSFFIFVQTEHGDILNVSLDYTETKEVLALKIQYLDTIPQASSLAILKTGVLFVGCEAGNHTSWEIHGLGDGDVNPKICSSSDEPDHQVVYFPHTEVKHFKLIQEWPSLAMVTESMVEDLVGEGTPQVYTLCAAPNRSTLRVLKHGLAVDETPMHLPFKPSAMWTLKEKITDPYIKYIVLAQARHTMVLVIGDDGKIVEHKNTVLETRKHTLLVSMMIDSSIVQVFPTGFRHVRPDGKFDEFTTESGKISHTTCNGKQLIFNVGNEISYFELNQEGKLVSKGTERVDSEINCLAVGDVPRDKQRCKLLAVGFADNTVRIFSLDTDSTFLKLSNQAVPAAPESVSLMEYEDPTNVAEEGGAVGHLFLHIGLKNGHLYKTAIDDTHGTLSETRSRLIGTAPVRLFKIKIGTWRCLIAISNRVWISYLCKESYLMTPLNCKGIEYVGCFNNVMYKHGIVGIGENSLKIFKVEGMGEIFSERSMPLRYTPRKILAHERTKNLIVLEGQHRTYSLAENKLKLQLLREKYPQEPNFSENLRLQAPTGTWASCVRVVNPRTFETLDLKELQNNETAISMALVDFEQHPGRTFLLIGTIKDYMMMPKSYTGCFIHTFILNEEGKKLELVHSTTIENIPYSMAAYKGKLLASVGYMLRLYDLGKNQLLKKCEYKHMYMGVNRLLTYGDRIFATDLSDSFHLLKHKARENQFVEIADDVLPRWMTSAAVLDYHTVVGADKFENMFVCRLPEGVDEEGGEDYSTYKFKWEAGYLNGASCKFEQICNYFLGEVATTLHKRRLSSTANEVIFYGTSSGSLGVMYPLETKEEVDFFVHLEMNMRIQNQPLSGRDHLAFRSYHGASKNVIDGDYCEQFGTMQKDRQINLADELQRKPNEVMKKLEDIRNKIL